MGWFISAAVPYDHVTRAVIARRNSSFKISVLIGVIFDSYGEMFFLRVQRRTFRQSQLLSTPSISKRKS